MGILGFFILISSFLGEAAFAARCPNPTDHLRTLVGQDANLTSFHQKVRFYQDAITRKTIKDPIPADDLWAFFDALGMESGLPAFTSRLKACGEPCLRAIESHGFSGRIKNLFKMGPKTDIPILNFSSKKSLDLVQLTPGKARTLAQALQESFQKIEEQILRNPSESKGFLNRYLQSKKQKWNSIVLPYAHQMKLSSKSIQDVENIYQSLRSLQLDTQMKLHQKILDAYSKGGSEGLNAILPYTLFLNGELANPYLWTTSVLYPTEIYKIILKNHPKLRTEILSLPQSEIPKFLKKNYPTIKVITQTEHYRNRVTSPIQFLMKDTWASKGLDAATKLTYVGLGLYAAHYVMHRFQNDPQTSEQDMNSQGHTAVDSTLFSDENMELMMAREEYIQNELDRMGITNESSLSKDSSTYQKILEEAFRRFPEPK